MSTPQAHTTDRRVLAEVTNVAAEILTSELRRRAAISYLEQRGIHTHTLGGEWSLGYAPPGWTRLTDQLQGSFPDQALIEAGVARRSSRGSLIDTFRDRVLFGIRAADGTIAGFIGRDLSGDAEVPKYINTHQSPMFDKGSLLYGFHEGANREPPGQPVVVEGPLDVLAITARQRPTDRELLLPVAPCGTAFTVTHARRVAEIAQPHGLPVVIAMDSDAAGRKAALDAGERLRLAGLDVRAATLPNGSDPADFLARPDTTLDTFRFAAGLPLMTLRVHNAIARQGERMQWIEGRLAAAREIATYLATYPASTAARQIGWVADVLRLDAATVTAELAKAFGRTNNLRSAHSVPEDLRLPPFGSVSAIGGIA